MYIQENRGASAPFFCPQKYTKLFNISDLDNLISSLQKATTEKMRREALFAMGAKIMASGKEWPEVNWVQFALMHTPLIVGDTEFDKGNTGLSIDYWNNLLDLWERGEGLFLEFTPDSHDVSFLKEQLECYRNLYLLIPRSPLDDNDLYAKAAAFLNELEGRLQEYPSLYIPLGYKGGMHGDGHHLPLHIEQKAGYVKLTFLNQGEGFEHHPFLEYVQTAKKASYRFFPIKIPNDVFFGETGKSAFCFCFRFLSEPPSLHFRKYGAQDIIQIFLRMGKAAPFSKKTDYERLALASQPGPSCAEQGVKLVLRDLLYTLDLSRPQIDRFFLSASLCSLIAGYHTYIKNPKPEAAHLILNAAKELGIATESLALLSSQERILCEIVTVTLINYFKDKTHSITQEENLSSISLSEYSTLLPHLTVVEKESIETDSTAPSSFIAAIDRPAFCAESFSSDLKEWVAIAEELPPEQARRLVYQVIMALPIPVGEKKGSYEAIAPGEVNYILSDLKTLTLMGVHLGTENEPQSFFKNYSVVFTAYALADHLARRVAGTQLDGFASPFPPHLFSFKSPSSFLAFPWAEEMERFEAIEAYFTAQNGRPIFPFQEEMPIGEWYEKFKKNPDNLDQTTNHFNFLKQFLKGRKMAKKSDELYADLWFDERELPPEVSLLHYFAFASYLLFSCDNQYLLPKELRFKSSKGRSQLVFKIEAESGSFTHSIHDERPFPCPLSKTSHLNRDNGFIEFFLKAREGSTNQVMCLPLSEYEQMPEGLLRELLRISAIAELRFITALNWAALHLNQMGNPYVQWAIELCLFSRQKLTQQLEQRPEWAFYFAEWVDKGINLFSTRPSEFKTLLFFLTQSLYFESYLSQSLGNEASEKHLAKLASTISHCMHDKQRSEEQKRELLPLYLLAILKSPSPDFKQVISLLFREKRKRGCQGPLWEQVFQQFFAREAECADFFENEKNVDPLCQEILALYGVLNSGNWSGTFPTFSSGMYTVDVREQKVWNKLILLSDQESLKERPEKQLIVQGEKEWAFPVDFKKKDLKQAGLLFLRSPRFTCYSLFRRQKERFTLYVMDQIQEAPYARIDFTPKGICVSLVDGGWNPLSLRLVNPASLPGSAPSFLNIRGQEIACWVNSQTDVIEQLNFYDLDLEFVNQGGRLFCQDPSLKGFFLAEESVKELNGYTGSLVLKNDEGRTRVILPYVELITSNKVFATKVLPTRHFISEERWVELSIDLKTGKLTGERRAKFYLIYLLTLQGAYDQALNYLKTQKPGSADKELVLAFLRQTECSPPSALALTLHLLLHLFDQENTLVKEHLMSSYAPSAFIKDLAKRASLIYLDYLDAMKEFGLSSIPIAIRISLAEERRLIRALKQLGTPEYATLTMREHLLLSEQSTLGMQVYPTTVELAPKELAALQQITSFSDLRLIGTFPLPGEEKEASSAWSFYPIRVDNDYVTNYFISLCQEALAAGGGDEATSFDLILLTLIREDLTPTSLKLVKVLFLMRHFPNAFSGREYELCCSDAEGQKEAFHAILKQCETLCQGDAVGHLLASQEQKLLFDYDRWMEIPVPKEIVAPKLPIQPRQRGWESPTEGAFHLLFDKEIVSPELADEPPFLGPSRLPAEGTLKRALWDKLLQGYQEQKKGDRAQYGIRSDDLKGAQSLLKNELQDIRKREEILRKRINRIANRPKWSKETESTDSELFEEITVFTLKSCDQMLKLTFSNPLIEATLKGDGEIILQMQNNLSEAQVSKLMTLVIDYYLILRQRQHVEASLEEIEKLGDKPGQRALLALASLLDQDFYYDPYLYPDLLIYEVVSGLRLRKDQAEEFVEALGSGKKLRSLLYSLPAGGGKTSVLALIFLMRAAREGYFPILLTHASMYSIERDHLIERLIPFGLSPAFFELDITQEMTARILEKAYYQLKSYAEKKQPLILTPETYYALYLNYLHAGIVQQDALKIKWLSLILFEVFEEKGFLLVDEPTINLNPLLKAIFGVSRAGIPKEEQALFLELFFPLIHDPKISAYLRLDQNEQGLRANNTKFIEGLKEAVALHMLESPTLDIDESDKAAIFDFWLDEKVAKPPCLVELAAKNREKAGLIVVVRYFIQKLLFDVIHEKAQMDHAPSLYPEEEFDVPLERTLPTHAHYECPYRALAMSTQGTFCRGLSFVQFTHLIETIQLIDSQEKELLLSDEEVTSVEQMWLGWLESTPLTGLRLEQLSINHLPLMRRLFEHLQKHKEVIEYYLLEKIYAQVTYSPLQLTCTPSQLLRGFKGALLYSATPGIPQIYPRVLESFREDLSFQAAVVTQFCAAENQERHLAATREPKAFFMALLKEKPEVFNRVRVISDPTGFFCDSTNEQVAHTLLDVIIEKHLPVDGVVYFKNGDSIYIELKNYPVVIEVEGSNIKAALRQHHFKWEDLELITLYDPPHTLSADIVQKPGISGLLLAAPGLTLSYGVQAIMRMREFLEDQNVMWVFFEEMVNQLKLEGYQPFDGPAITDWMISNESDSLSERVILSAFQEIDYHVQSLAMRDLKNHLYKPHIQLELLQHYKNGFLEVKKASAFERLDYSTTLENTEVVLWNYAEERYADFGFNRGWEDIESSILSLVEETSAIVGQLFAHTRQSVGHSVREFTHVKEKTRQVLLRSRAKNLSAVKDKRPFSILEPGWEKRLLESTFSANELFATSFFSHHLRFSHAQIETAKEGGRRLKAEYLKPVDYLLISGKIALALSNEEMLALKRELESGPDRPVFIITSQGWLVHNGGCSHATVESTLASKWLKNVLVDIALLQGEIAHPDLLLKRLSKKTGFSKLWEKIVKALPHPERANQTAIRQLT